MVAPFGVTSAKQVFTAMGLDSNDVSVLQPFSRCDVVVPYKQPVKRLATMQAESP